MDLTHFNERAIKSGKTDTGFTEAAFRELLNEKIAAADIELIKKDIYPFVSDVSKLDIWSREYFSEVAKLMKING